VNLGEGVEGGRRSGGAVEGGVELKQRKEEWRKEEVEGEWRGEGY